MRGHFPSAALVLGLWISLALPLARGQDRSGWEAAVNAFEAKGARLLLPVHQLLLSELETAIRQAGTAGDTPRKTELEAAVIAVRRNHQKLTAGRVPHADMAEAAKDAFLRAANGRQWALIGTRNIKRIGIAAGGLHTFTEEGRDLGELSRQQILPGLFANRRNDGDGWACYLISPALDLAHCVVTTQISEGRVAGRENMPLPGVAQQQHPAPPPPEPGPATARGNKEELHVMLQRKYRTQLLEHEQKLIRLLEDRLASAGEGDRDAISLRLEQARVALALGRADQAASALLESAADFQARLNGCKWVLPRMRAGHHMVVTGGQIQTVDVDGRVVEQWATETLWPGVMRTHAPDGMLLMVVFSPDLKRLLTFPVRSQYPARRVEWE